MFDYCFAMRLPLETLPGWPEVADPSLGALLLILFVIPAVISLPIVLIGMGPTWRRRNQDHAPKGAGPAGVAVRRD